ncbi:MAG: phage tail sheath family protein [Faecalibacterium sp.]
MAFKHGAYSGEQATSLASPITSGAGLQVVIGTAPVHLAENPYATVGKPIICYDFSSCEQQLGYSEDFKSFTLCEAMDFNFRVFNNAPLIFINVLDPSNSNHTQKNSEESVPVSTDGTATYDKKYVLLDTLVVKSGSQTLERGTDYVASFASGGSLSISLLIDPPSDNTLKISSTSIDPQGVSVNDIVGGYNAKTGAETGIELVRRVYPLLGLVPGNLLAPGWSWNPVVAAALSAKTNALNGNFKCMALVDIAADENGATVYTDCKKAKTALGATDIRTIVFWPKAVIGTKQYYLSTVCAALMAATDADNGDVPYDSPSNLSGKITGTVLKDGTSVLLDQQQANDILNAQGITTAINSANGYVIWGNHTASYPGTSDPKDHWINCRRMFNWDANNFILTYSQYVDRNYSRQLIRSIVDSRNMTGNGYVAKGYLAAYKCTFLDSENTETDIIAGHLTTHTYLAPYVPAEAIENINEFDVSALSAALKGE